MQELKTYETQMAELQSFGDLMEVNRYLKRAEALSTRLDEAADKIEGFNKEEDAFDWDRSQYPLRAKLSKTLDPFLNLYKSITEFQKKHTYVCAIVR